MLSTAVRRLFQCHAILLLLACLLTCPVLGAPAAPKTLQVKLTCTQLDSLGKSQGQTMSVLAPSAGYSYTVKVSAAVSIKVERDTGPPTTLKLRYYVLYRNQTYGPTAAVLAADSEPVQNSFYLDSSTLIVRLVPIAAVADAPKPLPSNMEVCPDCAGSGKCARCDGTGHKTCTPCGGTGKCHFCHGTGACPHCGGNGVTVYGKPCVFCQGSGNCMMCSGSGACVWCGGHGFTGQCPACEGSGVCPTCGGSGQVPKGKPQAGQKGKKRSDPFRDF